MKCDVDKWSYKEDLISKLYEEVVKGDKIEVHEDRVYDDEVQDGKLNDDVVDNHKVNMCDE